MAKRFVKYETENPVGVDAEGVLTGGGSGGSGIRNLSEFGEIVDYEHNLNGNVIPTETFALDVNKLPVGMTLIINDVKNQFMHWNVNGTLYAFQSERIKTSHLLTSYRDGLSDIELQGCLACSESISGYINGDTFVRITNMGTDY